ncbi:putative transposable element tc1 transposase [Ixodes scapularis]
MRVPCSPMLTISANMHFSAFQKRAEVEKGLSRSYLLEDRCLTKLPWPPKGADLNIIEDVWRRIKVTMSLCSLPRATAAELWDVVRREWQRLRAEPGFVAALCDTLPLQRG